MSNKVSVLAYSRRLGSPVRKAVMVYFAERASDNGEGVWASKSSIAAAVECGRSTVIRTINDFVEEGLLRVVGERRCRTGATIEYAINLDALASLEAVSTHETCPAAGPVPERDPSQSGTRPVPQRDPYPSRSGTQTIIGTIKEPSVSNNAREIRDTLLRWAGTEAVDSFIAYRRKQKGKALSLTAAKRLAASLKIIFDSGGDTDDALGLAEERGWQTVKPDWYFKEARNNGNANGSQGDWRNHQRGGPGQQSSLVGAFAAVAERRSRDGRERC